MSKVKITETVLRDAHQSLIATRMKTEEMLPILGKLDAVGYHSLEMWGGATFDSALRFLNEDPWDRLRKIRASVKNTKLQMLLRGQNILGYKHYSDDVVQYFIQKSIANGIDIIRIFDALNDVRNLESSIKACKKEGGHAQGAFSYTTSPVHNIDYFVKLAKTLEGMGSDSICIKDMAGLLLPYAAFELVTALKKKVKIPIQLHTHYTSGVASMTYLKSIEAGVDIIDCAISPFAMGTSQPPTEPMVATLKDTAFDTGLDLFLLSDIAEYFRPLLDKYFEAGLLDIKMLGVDINALKYQIPGGMLSNLISQLRQANAMDKYEEVLKEVPHVRKDFGYPPLVTPTSQIVGTQAVLNVVTGERYKMVPRESKALVKGEYGKTPSKIPIEISKKILGDEEPITCRPADLIPPELDAIRSKIATYIHQDEDVLTYALFPSVAEKYFINREKMLNGNAEDSKNEEIAAVMGAIVALTESEDNGKQPSIKNIRVIEPGTMNLWSLAGRLERLRNTL